MGDIFVATTVVAGLIAMAVSSCNFVYADADGASRVMGLLMVLAVLAVMSSVAVVPVSIMYFRASTRRHRVLVLLGFGAAGLMGLDRILCRRCSVVPGRSAQLDFPSIAACVYLSSDLFYGTRRPAR